MSKAVEHNNVVIFDDRGIPSIMVRFMRPKDTEETPAMFRIGDKVVDAIYISKYPNKVINGRAYSLPMVDPTININFDEAVQACRTKGSGWHLMTAVEWEYLLNQSRQQDTLPHGNTDYGKDYYHKDEQGDREGCGYGRTLTGSGPATWYHNHDSAGIADLNGNLWEWTGGLRLVDGEIQIIPYGNCMKLDCDMSAESTLWKAIMPDGRLVEPGTAGTLKIDQVSASAGLRINTTVQYPTSGDGYRNIPFKNLVAANGVSIPKLLIALGVFPEESVAYGNDNIWVRNHGERLPVRGSAFDNSSSSGPSALFLAFVRSLSSVGVGFRSAFCEL